MMHRALRPLVVAAALSGLLVTGIAGDTDAAANELESAELGFEEIEEIARTRSPRLRILEHEMAAVVAERDGELTWSNPALAYDHEQTGDYSEWQVTLHKRVTRPFSRADLREGWDGRVRSEELRGAQTARDVLAELKAGYVRLRLLETRLERLERLGALVDLAAGVARSRHAEGELSGLDRRLIQMANYVVDSTELGLRADWRRLEAAWRSDMGIPPDVQIGLTTPIGFHALELGGLATFDSLLAATPGDRAQSLLAESLGRKADAARPGLVPGFDVYGGYKRFEPDLDGFVAGIAVDLPLFDGSRGKSARLTARQRIVESGLKADRARRLGEVATLISALGEAQPLLASLADPSARESLADALLLSYREGSITLDELLGAIQIEVSALESHHEDLAAYYENAFRLEALTGQELVRFADKE